MKYEVTKQFTKGILKGLTITEQTSVNFTLNKQYGDYKIINIKEV
jgi:hypothetical protein